jgi:hypothetical protein
MLGTWLTACCLRSRFSEFIKRRAVDPEAPVPPWSDDLLPRAIATPKAVEAVAAFAAAAPTRAAPPSKRGGRHQEAAAGDAADAAEEPDAKRHREDHLPPFTLAAEAAPRILIGDTDPLTDFSREMAKATDVVAKLTVLHAMPQACASHGCCQRVLHLSLTCCSRVWLLCAGHGRYH